MIKFLLMFLVPTISFAVCLTDTVEHVQQCTINDRLIGYIGQLRPAFRQVSYEDYNLPDPCIPIQEVICETTCTTICDQENNCHEECPQIDPECIPVVGVTCPPWNPKFETYTFINDGEQLFENLIIDPVILLSDLESLHTAWQGSVIEAIQFRARLDTLGDSEGKRELARKCGIEESNIKMLFNRLFDTRDSVAVACMESKVAELNGEKAFLAVKEKVLKDMDFGKNLYAEIRVLNISKSLTKQQKKDMKILFKNIRDFIYDGDICSAREEIAAITPDGVLVKDAEKAAVLTKIDAKYTCL